MPLFIARLIKKECNKFLPLAIILVLFILGDILTIYKYLAFIFLVIYLVLNDIEGNSLAIFFLAPAQRFITIVDGGATFINAVILYLFLQLLMHNKIRMTMTSLYCFLFTAVVVVLGGIYNGTTYSILIYIKLVFILLVLSSLISYSSYEQRYRFVLYYLVGSASLAFLPLILLPAENAIRGLWGAVNNPNYIGVLLAFSLSVVIVMKRNILIKTEVFLLFTFLFVGVGLLTLSRTFVLAASISFAYVFIVNFFKLKVKTLVLMSFLVFALGGVVAINQRFYSTLLRLKDRVFSPKNDDVSGGRLEIWKEYYNNFESSTSSLFFGNGENVVADGMYAHNAFIEDVSTFGMLIIPFVYATIIFFLFLGLRRKLNLRLVLLPLLILILSRMFSHSFLGLEGVVQLAIVVILALLVDNKNGSYLSRGYRL